MIGKISDFKLAESVLKSICREEGVSFVDIFIEFGESKEEGIVDEGLSIGMSKNVSHTIYKIVNLYISNSINIVGKQLFADKKKRDNFLISFANNLRNIIYEENVFSNNLEELTLQHLYQRPLVWLLMKDLVCPVNHVPLDNIKVVCGFSPYVDIAKYYKEGDIKKENVNYPFIFVNQVDSQPVQNAFLFFVTIEAYGLNSLDVIKEIFESDLYDKFNGLLKLGFNDNAGVDKFIFTLISITGINLLDFVPIKKMAQRLNPGINPDIASQWWYLGVLERMLEPARGADWSTYQTLEKYHEDFWNKVEKVKEHRKKSNKDPGVPFDELLRLKFPQTMEYKADPNVSLQKLLSSNRIW